MTKSSNGDSKNTLYCSFCGKSQHEVRKLINGMAKDKIIVISTHILEEVDAICTRAMIIAKGRLLADDTPQALAARADSGRLDDVFRDITSGGLS